MLRTLVLFCFIAVIVAFSPSVNKRYSQSKLEMAKAKAPSVGNIPRKIKRKLRSLESSTFEQIYTPEFDEFLKTEAQGSIYLNLRKVLAKRARQVGAVLKADFGVKPVIVLPDIVDTAVAAGEFTTLVAAVTAAGLVDTLKSGSFTVFAPNDEAFAALGQEKIDELLADIPSLTNILKYHVVPGVLKGKKLPGLKDKGPETVQGSAIPIKVSRTDNELTLGEGAKVIKGDIRCGNGRIHVINKVLIPK